jgi:hypothetical protein
MEDLVEALTMDDFRKWMDRYGKACEDGDAQFAADLFTQDAQYCETPFAEPMIGRDAICRYWSQAVPTRRDVWFAYEILAVKENRGITLWRGKSISLRSGNEVVLDGVFLVEFAEPGKCNVFREWWHRQEIMRDEPK